MKSYQLPTDQALVLMQINESREEDLSSLSETLRLNKGKLTHIIKSLKNKGLIKIYDTAQDTWVRISSKGDKLVANLWPDSLVVVTY